MSDTVEVPVEEFMSAESDSQSVTSVPEKRGFISWFVSLIFGKNEKNVHYKELKQMNKKLANSGFVFYDFRRDTITPLFALSLYEFYSDVYSFRQFFLQIMDDKYYERAVINYYLSDEDRDCVAMLLPENIDRLAAVVSFDELRDKLGESYSTIKGSFKKERVYLVNELNRMIYVMKHFCTFDYYALLKKFDSYMIEGSFEDIPNFKAVRSAEISESLIDFFSLAQEFYTIKDWNSVFNFLSTFKGGDLLQSEKIVKAQKRIANLIENNVINIFSKLFMKDFYYEYKVKPYSKEICVSYINSIFNTMNEKFDVIKTQRKLDYINRHVDKLFPGKESIYLKKYNPEESAKYVERGFSGYLWAEPMGFLKEFFTDYVEDEIYKFMEVLISKSKPYDVEEYTKLKIVYQQMTSKMQELVLFDKNLENSVSSGYKLESYLIQLDQNEEVRGLLAVELERLNKSASVIWNGAQSRFIEFRGSLVKFLEDKVNEKNEIITNWDEIDYTYKGNAENVLRHIIELMNEIIGLLEIYRE